jgi:hypothetical protein
MIIKLKKQNLFFSKNPNLIYAVSFLFIVASYLFLDKSFALFAKSLGSELKGALTPFYNLMDPFFIILALSFLYFFVRFIQKKEKKSRKFLLVSLATTLVVFAVKILQVLIGRSSPEWFFYHKEMAFRLLNWNPHFHSFPSATSAVIATLTNALAMLNTNKSRLFLSLGFFLGIIPSLLNVCFLSDALGGIGIGFFLGKYLCKRMQRELSIF